MRTLEDEIWRKALRKGGRPVEIRREVAAALKKASKEEKEQECSQK